MREFWAGIAINLISDTIFIGVLILIGWFLVLIFRRLPLLRFFGLSRSRKITIYLSNLEAIRGGTRGVDQHIRSYQGTVITFGELLVANEFRDLFSYPFPSLSDKPGILNKLLVADVQVQLLPSPVSFGELERSAPFVALGSPGYNVASRYLEQEFKSLACFENDYQAIKVEGVQPETNTSYGFLERIIDRDQNRSLFYAAGISELGTMGAAYFLATEWQQLYQRHRAKKGFVIMLRFDLGDYKKWSIVFEKESPYHHNRTFLEDTEKPKPSIKPHLKQPLTTQVIADNQFLKNEQWSEDAPQDERDRSSASALGILRPSSGGTAPFSSPPTGTHAHQSDDKIFSETEEEV